MAFSVARQSFRRERVSCQKQDGRIKRKQEEIRVTRGATARTPHRRVWHTVIRIVLRYINRLKSDSNSLEEEGCPKDQPGRHRGRNDSTHA